jgi:hypothetical protein
MRLCDVPRHLPSSTVLGLIAAKRLLLLPIAAKRLLLLPIATKRLLLLPIATK